MRFVLVLALSCTGEVAVPLAPLVDTGVEDVADGINDNVDEIDALEEQPIYPLNGCSTFVDRSDASDDRTIRWDYIVSPACMQIRPGEAVTWRGELAQHPLDQQGGNPGSPIVFTNQGTSVTFTFDASGDFGFVCQNHAQMTGVVRATP